MTKNIRFEEWEEKLLKTPGFREVAEDLEPGYQVTRLRIMRGLTQKQLADLIGTKQSSIARLESGNSKPSLSFLRRVVEALDGKLEVSISVDNIRFASFEKVGDEVTRYIPENSILVENWPIYGNSDSKFSDLKSRRVVL